MNTLKTLFIVVLLFAFAAEVGAQGSRRRRGATAHVIAKPASAQTVPPEPAVVVPAPSAPIPLATVNGQSITTADIDPKVREEVDALEARIVEARRQVLELQINTLLLENEAAKRKMSSQQLYNLEIAAKIPEPTAAEINKFIEDNRDQIDQTDPVAMRAKVVAFLKGDREAQITDSFLKRARVANPVVSVAPANATNLAPTAVIVTVGGRPITAGAIDERLKPGPECGLPRASRGLADAAAPGRPSPQSLSSRLPASHG